MFDDIFDKIKEAYKNFMADKNEEETKETEGRKRTIYSRIAPTAEIEDRLFYIASYCLHNLEEEQINKLKQEWKEYRIEGKETGTPILPYYYYILEKMEFKLKK